MLAGIDRLHRQPAVVQDDCLLHTSTSITTTWLLLEQCLLPQKHIILNASDIHLHWSSPWSTYSTVNTIILIILHCYVLIYTISSWAVKFTSTLMSCGMKKNQFETEKYVFLPFGIIVVKQWRERGTGARTRSRWCCTKNTATTRSVHHGQRCGQPAISGMLTWPLQ